MNPEAEAVSSVLGIFKHAFLYAVQYDLFSLVSLLTLLFGALWGYFKFFRSHKSIDNLPVSFSCKRAEGWNFPLQVNILFSNHTGKSIHITSAIFKCKSLEPDPNSTADTSTRKVPLKFPKEYLIEGKKEHLLTVFGGRP